MYQRIKKEAKAMLLRDLIHDLTTESKQFKTTTGSPILYKKFKRNKGIYYYPLSKHKGVVKQRPHYSHKHSAVVISKTYGREVYGNVDIWPDDGNVKEILLRKLKGLSSSGEDLGIEIPKVLIEGENASFSAEDSLPTKAADDTRHVTITVTDTSEDDVSASSGGKQIYPDPDRAGSPSEGQGNWPLKRSHSIDSRDNPFLPGGDLSKEADDILKKATIIRDTFILKDEKNADKSAREEHVQSADTKTTESESQSSANQSPVKETVIQKTVSKAENAVVQNASPTKTRPKENGQVDTENSLTPGSIALENTNGSKDKKKQQKCCVVM